MSKTEFYVEERPRVKGIDNYHKWTRHRFGWPKAEQAARVIGLAHEQRGDNEEHRIVKVTTEVIETEAVEIEKPEPRKPGEAPRVLYYIPGGGIAHWHVTTSLRVATATGEAGAEITAYVQAEEIRKWRERAEKAEKLIREIAGATEDRDVVQRVNEGRDWMVNLGGPGWAIASELDKAIEEASKRRDHGQQNRTTKQNPE